MPIDEYVLERMLGEQWMEQLPPICPDCGYNLTGLPNTRCPECGRAYSRSEVRKTARDVWNALRFMDSINSGVNAGSWIGGFAFVVFFLCYLAGGGWGGFGRVILVLASIPTLAMGFSVFRVFQVPAWAREFLPVKPNFFKAILTILLGGGGIALAVLLP